MLEGNEILARAGRSLPQGELMGLWSQVGIGVVTGRGKNIGEVAIGDKVIWVGLPDTEEIVVPDLLFARITDGLVEEKAMFGGLAAMVIQAIRETGITFGEEIILTGDGLLKDIAVQVTALFGIHILELDCAKGKNGLDGIFLCPGGEAGFDQLADLLRDRATLLILTEEQINISPMAVKGKGLKIIYPRAFHPEKRGLYYPEAYARWTIKEDLYLALRLVAENKIIKREGDSE